MGSRGFLFCSAERYPTPRSTVSSISIEAGFPVGDVLLLLLPGLLLRLGHYLPAFRFTPPVFFGPFRVRAFVWVRCPWTGRLRRCRRPWYAPISILRLMSWATSRRRSPSTLRFWSIHSRIRTTSSSDRSRTFVSALTLAPATVARAALGPIP